MVMLKRVFAAIAALSLMSFLAGCGGGGAGAQGTSGGTTGSSAAALDVKTSTPSVGSDGRTIATITAFVKDEANRALANQQVVFSTTDTGSVLQVVSGRTDATGIASVKLQVNDQTNRNVPVTAVTGGQAKTINVAVVGTTITVNGPSSLIANAPADYTIGLRDSSGTVLVGKPVSVTSAAGNALSSATVTTDAAGQARFTLTGTKGGADTLTVSSLGAVATASVQISATQIGFSVPVAGQEVVVAQPQDVVVAYTVNGLPQVGQVIQFATTRGTLSAASAITDAAGQARVTVNSPTAGMGTVTAIAGSVVSSQRIEFVSRSPAKLTLQSSPANVGVNLSADSTNSSQLIAVVRDAADNPVKGQTVTFSAVVDPSNGRIEPAVATTDRSGVASAAFFPGANSSGFNQVEMRAQVPGTAVSGTTRLTATRQELFVRVGAGDVIQDLNEATYLYPWSIVVSDASGNPVQGASVQAALLTRGYSKGYWVLNGPIWTPVVVERCIGEDSNENLRLDAGEDTNGDGELTPGNVAVVNFGGVTDANGNVVVNIIYPKEYAVWLNLRLRVTMTTIAGTEGTATRDFTPPTSAQAVTRSTPPAGQPSPFGLQPGCDNRD